MLLPILLQMCAAVQPATLFDVDHSQQGIASEKPADQALIVQPTDASLLQKAPQKFVVFGPAKTPEGNEISRADDGLFYVNAIVNGTVVRFVIDTGATTVVLTAEDARRAGFAMDDETFTSTAQTAGGTIATAYVMLHEIVVGDKHTSDISAAVVRNDLSVSLLGQNWLNRVGSITMSRDKLVIR